jgi:hypothetical protein
MSSLWTAIYTCSFDWRKREKLPWHGVIGEKHKKHKNRHKKKHKKRGEERESNNSRFSCPTCDQQSLCTIYWHYHLSISCFADFLIYDNYNNHIINNNSDKNKILNLRMSARQWQWRGANTPLSVTFLLKYVIVSSIFTEIRHWEWRVCLIQIVTV